MITRWNAQSYPSAPWREQDRNGKTYLTGPMGGLQIFVFPNTGKEKQEQPDGRIVLAQREDGSGTAAKSTGVRCSPHAFRHTFAITFLRRGGNVFTLRELLGRTAPHMVNRYVALAQANREAQHRLYSPVEGMLGGKAKQEGVLQAKPLDLPVAFGVLAVALELKGKPLQEAGELIYSLVQLPDLLPQLLRGFLLFLNALRQVEKPGSELHELLPRQATPPSTAGRSGPATATA